MVSRAHLPPALPDGPDRPAGRTPGGPVAAAMKPLVHDPPEPVDTAASAPHVHKTARREPAAHSRGSQGYGT